MRSLIDYVMICVFDGGVLRFIVVPSGKHSTKKDDYLYTMIMVPPKQKQKITEFDQRTRREAFTVSPEGLKGVRVIISCLITSFHIFPFILDTNPLANHTVEHQRACRRVCPSSRRSEKKSAFPSFI